MSAAEEKREGLRQRLRAILAEVDPDAKVLPGPREDRMREARFVELVVDVIEDEHGVAAMLKGLIYASYTNLARFDDLVLMEGLVHMLKVRSDTSVDTTSEAEGVDELGREP